MSKQAGDLEQRRVTDKNGKVTTVWVRKDHHRFGTGARIAAGLGIGVVSAAGITACSTGGDDHALDENDTGIKNSQTETARPSESAEPTKTATPKPTQAPVKMTQYTTASGQSFEIDPTKPLPEPVKTEIAAKAAPPASTVFSGAPGNTAAANQLSTQVREAAEKTGHPVAYFFGVGGDINGKGPLYDVYASGGFGYSTTFDRAAGLEAAQEAAKAGGYELIVLN